MMETQPGQHIDDAARKAAYMANDTGRAVRFEFNGAKVTAHPGASVSSVVAAWDAEMKRQAAEYRASPAGIKAAKEAADRLAQAQRDHDRLMMELPLVVADEAKCVKWCADFNSAADHSGVTGVRFRDVCAILESCGWLDNDCVGMEKEAFERPAIMARWIIGQAINCMRKGLPPHGVTHMFADKYAALRAREAGR